MSDHVTKDTLMNIGKTRTANRELEGIGTVTLVEMSANRVIQFQQLLEQFERENAVHSVDKEEPSSWDSEEEKHSTRKFTLSQEIELLVFIVSQMVAEEDGTLMFADDKGRTQLKALQRSTLESIGEVCWDQFNQWTKEIDEDAEKS